MKKQKHTSRYLHCLLTAAVALGVSAPVSAERMEKLEESWYIGGGVGKSRLRPDGDGTGWEVTEENDTSKKVYGGVNLSKNFGLEAFWNDFGEAKMHNTKTNAEGTVGYRAYGANVVYHVPYALDKLHPIVKLGVAKIETEGNHLKVNQQNNISVMAGVGAEYVLDNGFRIRGEYERFDKDIDQVSIGLNWRPVLHKRSVDVPRPQPLPDPATYMPPPLPEPRQAPAPIPVMMPLQPAPEPIIQTRTIIKHVPAPAPKPIIKTRTIIKHVPSKPIIKTRTIIKHVQAPAPKPIIKTRTIIKHVQAPAPKPIIKTRTIIKHVPRTIIKHVPAPAPKPIVRTVVKHVPTYIPPAPVIIKHHAAPAPAPVRQPQARTLHKTLAGGSHFATNSATLTHSGRQALNKMVNDLLRDQVKIHHMGIVGHTDSIGTPHANLQLSKRRAATVANYLASRGLNRGLMSVEGRGESQPIANNMYAAGRAQNRRVNIVIKGSQTYMR